MQMTHDITRLLVRELDAFAREIALFPDDESVWRTVPGVTNAAGTLALHIAGSLQHFVGTELGGTSYVRDRASEFNTRGITREQVTRELAAARDVIAATLPHVSEAQLAEPMPGVPGGLNIRTGMFLVHLVTHAAFHLGQAGYIRRVLTGNVASAGPIALDVLQDDVRSEL